MIDATNVLVSLRSTLSKGTASSVKVWDKVLRLKISILFTSFKKKQKFHHISEEGSYSPMENIPLLPMACTSDATLFPLSSRSSNEAAFLMLESGKALCSTRSSKMRDKIG